MWLEVLYWISIALPYNVCVVPGSSERLDAPSICLFMFLYVGSYLLI